MPATAQARFLTLMAMPENESQAKEILHEIAAGAAQHPDGPLLAPEEVTALLESIYQASAPGHTPASAGAPAPRIRVMRPWRWIAAASVALLLAAGVYYGLTRTGSKPAIKMAARATDIAPGKNGAVLTLANGAQVVLDSLGNGVVATQNGAQVRLNNGQLAYDPTGPTTTTVAYNTITTPKGRQFVVTLPDGTRVWLNAASSLRYPTAFTGAVRDVEVTGEAYFEVAKDPALPFHVNVNNQAEIAVLGTHFNVNAYSNESSISTTLLEGSVRVAASRGAARAHGGAAAPAGSVVLAPGQQARLAGISAGLPTAISVVNNVDIDRVMAWKNGLFNFEDASLEEVMRQLERWYDIEVVYEKGVPDIELAGEMTKGVTLNDLMAGLEKLGVHSRLEGRRLIVMP
ncbi:MAG TPA: FecR domain-containing protein [Chitinophaga sp.]